MIDLKRPSFGLFFKAFSLLSFFASYHAANAGNATWGANASSAWYTGSNWAGGAFPGLQGTASSNTDIATFTSAFTGTTVGINMGTNSLNLGAVSIDNTRTTALNIGNSSATAGVLRLYGASVNSVSNVIVRNNSTGLFTLQAAQSGTMGVVLSNATDNIINIDNTGGVTISSILSGTGKLTKAGAGSGILTLSGNNSYSGGTVVTAGTLQLGAAGVLLDAGSVTMNGGTLKTGATTGFTETAGTLSLTDNSTIALGTGSHTLTFAASNGTTWTSGKMLTITGWTGTIGGASTGTAGKVFVGSSASGLTCTQLAQVQFTISAVNYPAMQLSTGELVPINTPTVSSISPTSATAGGSTFTLTVNGTNFIAGSVSQITWGGAVRTLTFSSTTQLRATINAADIASAGSVQVGVITGCTASNTQTFTINPAGGNSITTTAGSFGPYCNSSTSNVTLNFTTTGSFTGQFDIQMSDASGTFPTDATSQLLTFVSSTATSVTSTLPASLTAGTGYRFRVVNNTPTYYTSGDNGSNITISAPVTPAVSIAQTTGTNPQCAGSTVIFIATPTNGGTPSYQWKVNGGNVGSNSVTYSTAALTNGQTVTCQMTSGLSCVTSTTGTSSGITMTVNTAPGITTPPSTPATVCSGSGTVTLSVVASGTNLSYSWRKGGTAVVDGGVISGQGTTTLTLTNPTSANVASYDVVVSNSGCSSATSSSVNLTVSTAVTITTQPSTGGQTICQNVTASNMTVGGSGHTSWQWYSNSSASNSGGTPVSGATSSSFTPPTTAAGTTYYYCVVGGASPCASMTSNVSGAIVVNPAPATPTGTLTFTTPACTTSVISYSAPDPNIYWETSSGNTATTFPTTSPYNLTSTGFTIYARANLGSCWVTGPNTGTLTVNAVPNFTTNPTSKSVTAPATALFNSSASGINLSYKWQVNDGTGWQDISGATSSNYTTPATTAAMDGNQYRSIVSASPCQNDTSTAATLSVMSAVYLHNFNDVTSTNASPYATSPTGTTGSPAGVFATGLSASSWASSTGTFTNFGGNSGTSLSIQPGNGSTSTMTLTFTVGTGYQCSITAFDLWRQRSSTGPTISSITINGTQVSGAITASTSGSFVGATNVSTAVNNLTGTVTVVLNLTAPTSTGQNFRLDEFTLYGKMTTGCTTPSVSISGTNTGCTSATLTASGTAGNTYAWSGGSTPSSATNTFTSSGTYTVTATNSGCTASASASVTINGPVITTQPTNTTITTGANGTIGVVVSNAASYQWQVNTGSGFTNISNTGVYSGATTATLSITGATTGMNGYTYQCVIGGNSPCSGVTSNTVTLFVTNFVYQAGDYRPIYDYDDLSYNNSSSSATNNWEYYDGTSWGATPGGKAPQNASTTPTRVVITKYVYGGGNSTSSYNNIVVLAGGTLDLDNDITPTVDFIKAGKTLEVQNGGNLFVYGQIQMNSTANLIVRSGGYMEMGSANINNSHVMWNGLENFEPGSEVAIFDWGFTGTGAGSLMNVYGTITDNANGYKFGTLSAYVDPSFSWVLVGGALTVKLCDTLNLENYSANPITLTSNTSSPTVTIGRLNHGGGLLGLTASYSGSATQTVNILENLSSSGGGELDLFYNGGGTAGTINVNLGGNLTVSSAMTVANDATSGTAAVLNFNGTGATQYVDVAPTMTGWPLNINSGAYVALQNHDLTTNSNSSLTVITTVKTGGTFDFGFAADGITANVIKKVTTGANGTNQFVTQQGSTLKITSPDGIYQASNGLGNVQYTTTNKTFNQVATFWYVGRANQVTGDAITSASNGKQMIIEMAGNNLSTTLTQSTSLNNNTTISTTGGKLDIRKGQFLETTSAYITGSTGTLTMAAGTLYQIPALSASGSDYIPRMDGASFAYTLSGGTVELSGAGAQILRGNRSYYNVKYSGSNIYGTNYKNLSSNATINDSLIITGTTTVVNCVDGSLVPVAFTGAGGVIMDGGRLMIKMLNTTSPELTGVNIPYNITGGTVEFYGSGSGTHQVIRATDNSGNISYNNVDINSDAANTTDYNVSPAASFGIKGALTVYSPAVFQLDETENISGVGNFDVQAGSTFKYGSANGIKTSGTSASDGNIRITGTRALSTSASYGFVGNGSMVSGNGLPSSMVNMYIQKSGTSDIVTLTNTATATGVISFTKGMISTGSNELVSSNTATSSITGYGLNKYVIGNLRRYINGSGTYDFPLGNTSYYDLGTLNFNSQTGITSLLGYFTTGQSGTTPSGTTCQINGSKIIDYLNNGFWTFTPNATMSGGTYDVTLNAMGYTNAPTNANRMGVIKRADASSPWLGCGLLNGVQQSIAYGTHTNSTQSIASGVATAMRSGVTGFSDFGIGIPQIDMPLPVQMLYLTATPVDNKYIQLDWATASEINNSGFQIERSTDGVTFENIGWKDGHGNSNNMITYSSDDHEVAPNTIYYYRLKQVDYDGQYQHSNIVSATIMGEGGFVMGTLQPNPATNKVAINLITESDQAVDVYFTDMLGRSVLIQTWQLNAGLNNAQFDISALAQGVYHVTVKAANSYYTKVLSITR